MSPRYTAVRVVLRLLAITGLVSLVLCGSAIAGDLKPGVVRGVAWTSENAPIVAGIIRLRNLETGRIVSTTETSTTGQFAFETVPVALYLVELVSANGKVLAVGSSFHVESEQTASTLVRLPTRRSWYASMFANSAAAVIAAASSVGLTAIGSHAPPASPQ